jgi:HK97 gp10 family phage protein
MAKNKDLVDLTRRFAAIPREVRRKIKPAIEQGGDELVARMKYLAPSEEGDLQASIEVTPGPVDLSVTVSAGGDRTTVQTERGPFDVALAQEFGTKDMPRNSFFWPSVNTLKKRVRSRIDRAINKAVKEGWE